MDNPFRKFYVCDPNKNVSCPGRFKKNWCGVECKLTCDKEYSKNKDKEDK